MRGEFRPPDRSTRHSKRKSHAPAHSSDGHLDRWIRGHTRQVAPVGGRAGGRGHQALCRGLGVGRRGSPDGPGHLRGDGVPLADLDERLCAADERDPQGFSRTLQHAEWPETRIARGDLGEEIAHLKRAPGNDLIAYGGATFDQGLTRLGLVDEYRLMVQPAALGAGLPLFKDLPAPLHLELVEATTYPTGVAIHIYRPRSRPADQPVDPDQPDEVG